ncbi:stAR-related lipid transfer protein 7, mitochondrial [Elephas maximus indicus]|uniref:stAR-related lipid transfer protein 7, mitochondrial n=1 Tax=Elephas maximus indicus TaxID=99487 RepID=UPI0021170245|nr:stAR-related lipid transfer protein 7, mitochondrial [Elephas maximus indicus]
MFPRRPPAAVAAWLAGAAAAAAAAGARAGGLPALLASQCRFVTGLRVRRAQQIAQLYGRLYSESARRGLLGRLWRRLRGRPGPVSSLMAALAGAFVWDEERIQEEELQRSIDEMKRLEEMSSVFQSSGVERHSTEPKSQTEESADSGDREQPWEMVMDKKHFKLWRRPIAGTPLYQYRVFGTYTDVTPRQFFNVQLDTEYRKKWDALVIKLEVIERDAVSGSEVLHWVTHFPYPMYSRDYVYVRRYSVDQENNVMVLVSRAVEHPSVPESPEFVRVRSYESQMVIRPHKSFDENGFDYLLTYSDNPQTVFPRYCVSWMVSSGMPDFLEKLHLATLKAKNMEIKVKDYISSKPLDMGSEAKATTQSSERKKEGSHGPAQIEYA